MLNSKKRVLERVRAELERLLAERNVEETRVIPLSMGLVALVDARDYEVLAQHNWYGEILGSNLYAQRNVRLADGRRRVVRMHREVMGLPLPRTTKLDGETVVVDHLNHVGLDNPGANLQLLTSRENLRRRRDGLYDARTSAADFLDAMEVAC